MKNYFNNFSFLISYRVNNEGRNSVALKVDEFGGFRYTLLN